MSCLLALEPRCKGQPFRRKVPAFLIFCSSFWQTLLLFPRSDSCRALRTLQMPNSRRRSRQDNNICCAGLSKCFVYILFLNCIWRPV